MYIMYIHMYVPVLVTVIVRYVCDLSLTIQTILATVNELAHESKCSHVS